MRIATRLIAFAIILFMAVAGMAFLVESSLGPLNIGSYSVSGPRTWTAFPGKAKVIMHCGRYKIWKRDDLQVTEGT